MTSDEFTGTAPIADWLNWADVPLFLAVAQSGSLLKAARITGLSQPTIGRRLLACEERFGGALFLRRSTGMTLTAKGHAFLTFANSANAQLCAAKTATTSHGPELRGTVRLTASEWLCERVLAPMVADFVSAHPFVCIDLVADAAWLNLPRNEADVAIRPARFLHQSVYQVCLGEVAFGLYASASYLAEHGHPLPSTGFQGHRLLTMQAAGGTTIADVPWLRKMAAAAHISARCNGRRTLAELALAGAGIACLPRIFGDALGALRLLELAEQPPRRKLWLGLSRQSRDTARVRAIVTHLRSEFAAKAAELSPK